MTECRLVGFLKPVVDMIYACRQDRDGREQRSYRRTCWTGRSNIWNHMMCDNMLLLISPWCHFSGDNASQFKYMFVGTVYVSVLYIYICAEYVYVLYVSSLIFIFILYTPNYLSFTFLCWSVLISVLVLLQHLNLAQVGHWLMQGWHDIHARRNRFNVPFLSPLLKSTSVTYSTVSYSVLRSCV